MPSKLTRDRSVPSALTRFRAGRGSLQTSVAAIHGRRATRRGGGATPSQRPSLPDIRLCGDQRQRPLRYRTGGRFINCSAIRSVDERPFVLGFLRSHECADLRGALHDAQMPVEALRLALQAGDFVTTLPSGPPPTAL